MKKRKNKEFVSMKVDLHTKKKLDMAQRRTQRSYSDLIQKYLPDEEDIWKAELAERIDALKRLFPQSKDLWEDVRYIFLYLEELPDELKQKGDKEVESKLKELLNYVLKLRKAAKEDKSVLPKGRTKKME